MAWDMDLNKKLRQNNARFQAFISRIVQKYNCPFEDDLLVSMQTLTYNTPEGPKRWESVSTKKLRKWKRKLLECTRGIQRNAGTSKQQTSDFEEGHSAVHQEFPENSCMDTSDIGEESGASIASIKRQLEDFRFQNLYVDDGKIQEKVKVQVDVIVQEYARNIPKWITVTPPSLSEGLRLGLPEQELIGNQATVCRKKVELSSGCSSFRPLQSQFSGIPISRNTVTISGHQPSSELNETYCDSVLEEYQSADEECSWTSLTVADLYPAMVQVLTKFMAKQPWRKELKYMFRHIKHKRWRSRKPKLDVTVDKIRGFTPAKLKQALPSICSSRSEDIQNQTFGNENRELGDDMCSISNVSGLVPYSYTDTNEIKMDCSDSDLENGLLPGKDQEVSKQSVFLNVMDRMGETFLVEDELQTAVSLKNSKCKESEKLAYKCSPEYCSITSSSSSGSTALHLVKESKTQKSDFPCGDNSELFSSTCSSYGISNTFIPVTDCSLSRASNTLLINPEKIISERQIPFQHKHSFSALSVEQSPSKMLQKYEDAFEKLYYKLYSKEIQKPLILRRPLSNSQDLEKRGMLAKRNLNDSVRSNTQHDREFDRIYEQFCSKAVPKLPGFLRASSLRKYEGIQMSETVNANINSPVQTLSAIPRVKRVGNFQNDLFCSPVKRLKNTPEHYFPSTKCQQIYHGKNVNLQTAGMDFLCTYDGSNSSFFGSHNSWTKNSSCYASSDKTFLSIPATSLQETGIADYHSEWPRAMMNCSCPKNVQKGHQRISKKLIYTDGKDENLSNPLDNFLVKSHEGAFTNCYGENIVL